MQAFAATDKTYANMPSGAETIGIATRQSDHSEFWRHLWRCAACGPVKAACPRRVQPDPMSCGDRGAPSGINKGLSLPAVTFEDIAVVVRSCPIDDDLRASALNRAHSKTGRSIWAVRALSLHRGVSVSQHTPCPRDKLSAPSVRGSMPDSASRASVCAGTTSIRNGPSRCGRRLITSAVRQFFAAESAAMNPAGPPPNTAMSNLADRFTAAARRV